MGCQGYGGVCVQIARAGESERSTVCTIMHHSCMQKGSKVARSSWGWGFGLFFVCICMECLQ